MIYGKDIFDSAYALVYGIYEKKYRVYNDLGLDSEIPNTSFAKEKINEEIEARFPYILASACSDLSVLDSAYRETHGLEERGDFSATYIALDEPFPLLDIFINPCALYCASMLVIDANSECSDRFFEQYADAVSAISTSLPYTSQSIVEKY